VGSLPALQALEDRVGDPLYYPFALGNPEQTRPMPGKVFKLPSVFVEQFESLSDVARETRAAEAMPSARRGDSWWSALDGLLEERPKVARAR
jgi:hypothetical protein